MDNENLNNKRKKKLAGNTIAGLSNQLIATICGFILPYLILTYYGSNVNGLVSSITSYLGLISLMELGVGAVVISALYKPLAEGDENQISKIVISAERFFRKVALLFLPYIIIVALIYPIVTKNLFDYIFTASLILIIAISLFAQYYFGLTYQLLLSADQKSYIYIFVQTLTIILNTLACYILIRSGASIHFVKLTTAIIFLVRPLTTNLYVRKHYKINREIVLTEEPIKQKWNGLSQHIASVVLNSTDVVVLTIFTSLSNVSVYSVYAMITQGIKQLVLALTTGIQATLGNMLANEEYTTLNRFFNWIEFTLHTIIIFTFTCTGILIVPLVQVYTKNVTDANYFVPVFAILFVLSTALYCLRLPYSLMVLAAGHYKETQKSAIIEMLINIVLSVILAIEFGLVGVAIGTLVAMTYRTCYYVWYLSKTILLRKVKFFRKHIYVDAVSAIIMVLLTMHISMTEISFQGWLIMAVKVAAISISITITINFIFYRNLLLDIRNFLKRK